MPNGEAPRQQNERETQSQAFAGKGKTENIRPLISGPLGRFLQKDPNGTGATLLDGGAWVAGARASASTPRPQLTLQRSDGHNTYQYLRENPLNCTDASGLFLVASGGSTVAVELYQEYSENAFDVGMSMKDAIQAGLGNYGWDQLIAYETIADHSMPDSILDGMSLAGLGGIPGLPAHHLIPRFLLGLDHAANLLQLPEHEHKRYHSIMYEEFHALNLPLPNATGEMNWKRRLLSEKGVPTEEINRARKALMSTACRFDDETKSAYDIARRTRVALTARLHGELLDVGRWLRRRRNGH